MSLWNRLLGSPTNRAAGEIFYWKPSVEGEWVSEISDLLQECGLEENYFQRVIVNVEEFENQQQVKCVLSWAEETWQKSKLRRSLCAQIRCGILPQRCN